MRTDAEDHAMVLANVDHFRAVAFRGRGVYDSLNANSLTEARALAIALYKDRPVAIYAVALNLDGATERARHVENWEPKKGVKL